MGGDHLMIARRLRGVLSANQIAHIHHRHFTTENLKAALRDIIDCFSILVPADQGLTFNYIQC